MIIFVLCAIIMSYFAQEIANANTRVHATQFVELHEHEIFSYSKSKLE